MFSFISELAVGVDVSNIKGVLELAPFTQAKYSKVPNIHTP